MIFLWRFQWVALDSLLVMALSEKSPGIDHLRCVVCGKLSRPDRFGFNLAWVAGHKLEILYQRFVGRYHGTNGGAFIWERTDKSGDADYIEMWMDVLRKVYKDLSEKLKALGRDREAKELEEDLKWLELSAKLNLRVSENRMTLAMNPVASRSASAETERSGSSGTDRARPASSRSSLRLRTAAASTSSLSVKRGAFKIRALK